MKVNLSSIDIGKRLLGLLRVDGKNEENLEIFQKRIASVILGLGFILFSIFWAFVYISWDIPLLGYNLIAGGILGVVFLWLLVTKKEVSSLLQFGLIVFFTVVLVDEYFTGGFWSVHTVTWLVLIPVCAVFLTGIKSGLIWSGIFAVEIIGFFLLQQAGYQIHSRITPEHMRLFNVLCAITSTTSLMAIVIIYELTVKITLRRLKESEEKFRLIFETAPVGIYRNTLDPSGSFIIANPEMARIFGYDSEEEFLETSVRDLYVNPEERNTFIEEIMAKGLTKGIELKLKKKDNTPIVCQIFSTLHRDRNNKPLYADGFVVDVTERKRIEEDIKIRDIAISSSINGVAIGDLNGKITYVNDAFLKMWGGQDTSEVIGKPATMFAKSPDEARLIMEEVLEKGIWVGDLEGKTKDGSIRSLHLLAAVIKDSKDKPMSLICSFVDITETKRIKEEKRIMEEQLQQAQKMEAIGRLAGGIAHDFNNLLTVITGNLSIASMRAPDALKRYINNALKASNKSAELVQQILLFSRKARTEFQKVDLAQVVTETADLLRQTIDRRIEIVTDIEPGTWVCTADTGQIQQVIMNLVVNARDAIMDCIEEGMDREHEGVITKDYRIILSLKGTTIGQDDVSRHPDARQGDFVVISVTDNGKGIDQDILRHIFEPFFTTKERGKGTGLGLSTVTGIVKQHAGWIEVESVVGSGTSFSIYLPRDKDLSEVSNETSMAKSERPGDATILVADDEEMIVNLLKTILEAKGYHVLTALNGEEALEIYKGKGPIDLVILDLSMPRLSGKEILRQIMAMDPSAKVIVSTGYSIEDQLAELKALGARGFMEKPFSVESIPDRILEVLSS